MILPPSFYARDVLAVAPALLGKLLVRGEVALRITEVEAYRGQGDTASHCRMGRTARNAPMWGPGGHAYVYLCYGIHHMLNIVSGAEGEGQAALIRACEPVAGLTAIQTRRGSTNGGPALLTGPGKVGQALGLDTSLSGHPLFEAGGLELRDGEPPPGVRTGPRVGIGYATAADQLAPWRFAAAGTAWVSQPKGLD